MTDDSSSKPQPKLKLQRPQTSAEAETPKPTLNPPPTAALSEPAPKDIPVKPLTKPTLQQPKEENSIKASEISSTPPEPKPTPPPLTAPARKPTAEPELAPGLQNRLDERAPEGAEQLLQKSLQASAASEKAPKARNGIGTSIALITVLILIFGGGGYTIWEMFLQSGGESQPSEPVEVAPATEPKNPIERTQATIDQVPITNMETITGESSVPVAPPVDITEVTAAEPTAEATAPTIQTGDLRTSVSSFLSSANIGMVRSGAKARVMLNNENYRIGDVVDPTTDLIFLGTKDGKLVFKDRNEVTYVKSF